MLNRDELEVVQILMDRDGLDELDAQQAVEDFKAQLEEVIADSATSGVGDLIELEQLIGEELGLEPDYLENFLV